MVNKDSTDDLKLAALLELTLIMCIFVSTSSYDKKITTWKTR